MLSFPFDFYNSLPIINLLLIDFYSYGLLLKSFISNKQLNTSIVV